MNEQHQALKKFGYQINTAVEKYTPHGFQLSDFRNVLISGLGGSGIGGRIAKSLYQATFPLPIECIGDYVLPHYVNQQTFVILCSYSGNTEETVSMFHEAKSRGCNMLILTSGGKLKELADQHNLICYDIESGFQPRMALGFSLSYLLLILGEFVKHDIKSELLQTAALFNEQARYVHDAEEIFEAVKNKTKSKFIVVTDNAFESIGIRFCQQIQENAKHECFHHALPEMNHNVIESYYGQLDSVFFFLHSNSHERVTARFDFLNNLLEVENNKIVSLETDGFDIKQAYEVIHTLDWLSLLVADQRRVNSLTVPNIASLKDYLDQI